MTDHHTLLSAQESSLSISRFLAGITVTEGQPSIRIDNLTHISISQFPHKVRIYYKIIFTNFKFTILKNVVGYFVHREIIMRINWKRLVVKWSEKFDETPGGS